MQEKIKWYQEVLELEPGSKVFFPLARLLVQTGQIDAALQVLQQGLVRYPEFIEARLYLIDVLFTHHRSEQCNEQVSVLTDLFASYTGFWQAWGAYLAHNEQGKETSLALTFLAASFQNPHLRLSDIFTQGLQNLSTDNAAVRSGPCGTDVSTVLEADTQKSDDSAVSQRVAEKCHAAGAALAAHAFTAPPLAAPESAAPAAFSTLHAVEEASSGAVPSPVAELAAPTAVEQVHSPEVLTATVPPLAELVQSLPAPRDYSAASDTSASAEQDDASDADGADDSEDGEERFSLRTRSMAEVLAEQGDFKNALDIYQELTAQAVTPEEQLDLQHRISTLTARMGSVQGQPADSPSLPDTAPGKHRLLSLLETLAVRFEAHAQG